MLTFTTMVEDSDYANHKKEQNAFAVVSGRLLRLQVVSSIGIFVGLVLAASPKWDFLLFVFLLSFLFSTLLNLCHLMFRDRHVLNAMAPLLLFAGIAIFFILYGLAYNTIGGN